MNMTHCKWRVAIAGLAGVALAAGAGAAQAQELKIGIIAVLSGPQAVLGGQLKDGFNLGVKHAGGKLGGLTTTVIVQDDELKPDVAVGRVKQLVERDQVDFVVGPVFSNILMAIVRPVTEAKVFLISPNAGTSTLAGKGCSPYVFVTSYQNDQPPEVLGKYAQDKGYKRAFLLAPNYQAGKDMVGGFKKHFKGEIADEVYTPLGQLDFSAELARIAAAKPDAFFVFMPGGMGVNLVKQYRQAGLEKTPFLSVFTVDEFDAPGTEGCGAWLLLGHDLGAQHRHAREQEIRRRLREGVRLRARQLRHAGLRRGRADRQRGEGGGRQARRQGCSARRFAQGGLQVGAREFQVQRQRLSDPGLLSGEGGEARGRQIPDGDRGEGVPGVRRQLCRGLFAEVRSMGSDPQGLTR